MPIRANCPRKMRVSLARALVTDPDILRTDEPFAALDEITRFRLNNDLLSLWRNLRKTVIFVTHSVFELVYLSQRVIVMTARPGRRRGSSIEASELRGEEFRRPSADNLSCAVSNAWRILCWDSQANDSRGGSSYSCFPSWCWPWASRCGNSGARQRYPALCAAGTVGGVPDARQRLRAPSRSLGVTLLRMLEGFISAVAHWRRRAGAVSFNQSQWLVTFLCDYILGHADRGRAVASDRSAAADRGDRMRLDRCVLSGALEHHARAEFGRSQSGGAVSALWREPDADAALSQISVSAALISADCALRAGCH